MNTRLRIRNVSLITLLELSSHGRKCQRRSLADQLSMPTSCPRINTCRQEEFELCIRKHHCALIASFRNKALIVTCPTLQLDETLPNRRVGGNHGRDRSHFRCSDLLCDRFTIDEKVFLFEVQLHGGK